MADSVLATYPWVDYIVRGEGELPFHALCTRLATQALDERPPRGVVSRQIAAGESGMWQVDDLDALPIPNYDAYYERVAPTGHGFLPIEGSRGPSVPMLLETVAPRYLCTEWRRMAPSSCPNHPKFPRAAPSLPRASPSGVKLS